MKCLISNSCVADEAGFKQYVAEKILSNLKRDFPDETVEALHKL